MIPRRNSTLFILVGSLLIIGLAIFFYRTEKPQPAAEKTKLNFVLISIDTTRADSIGIYGNQQIKTPNIDSIGRAGMVFKNAVAHVPLTLPSHASLLSGLLPAKHGIRDNHGYQLNAATPTLPSMLKTKDYKTAAFVSTIVLDHRFGLSKGFDVYDDFIQYGTQDSNNPQNERLAEATTSAAINWIASNHQSSFFLFIHYYDPHARYHPPEPFLSKYSSNQYLGEIAYVDEQIGKILESLNSVRENTIILITADHGEGLGDHDELGHGLFLYDSTIHIPFVLAGPGIPSKEISQQIQLIDVAPTILELAGIPQLGEFDGRSFVPLFSGKSFGETSAILETQYPLAIGWSPLYSARTSQWKIIDAPELELYDLKTDPKEITNRKSANDPTVRSMSDKLQKYKSLMSATQNTKTDPELEEQLRSLGYLSGSTKPKHLQNLPDPKSKIEVWKLYERATFLSMDGKQSEAIELLERAAVVDSTNPILFDTLGQFVVQADPKKAVEYWQKALRINPEDSKIHHRIALGFKRLGDIEKFIVEEKIALKIDPQMQEALVSLGETLAATGKPQEAIAYLQNSLELDPRNAPAAYELGNAYRNMGDFTRAAEQYEKAIQFNPSLAHPYYALAILKGQQGDLNGAEQLLKSALQRNPQFAEAYYNLGIILERQGRVEEAKQAYQNFISYADPLLHATRIETARKKINR
jgi:arylsulfatase A-like enzyme/Tfp pilus assembly protein PilF